MKYISLFSGIEAASVAWLPLGWEAVAFAEIEPFPSQVLAARFPNVPNLGDVTKVDWSEYHGKCDLIIGGSPCQSFSIAGLRKGLADPRGNLMLEYLRACNAIEPEWIIWENVPGVLSADKRRAFQTFLEAVVELWPSGGCAWRIMDAQFFGVAQRRRRLFAVINTRDWRRAAAVLFEPHSMRGDNPTSREKRQELTRAAGFSSGGDCRKGEAISLQTDHMGQNGRNHSVEVVKTLDVASSTPVVAHGFMWHQGAAGGSIGYGEVSPTIQAEKQPAVTYGFCGGASRTAGGIGYGEELSPTLKAGESGTAQIPDIITNVAPSVVCVADDNANAAIDEDMCGSLKVGGGCSVNSSAEEVVGALCARDYKGVGNQYVNEGKVVCQRVTS